MNLQDQIDKLSKRLEELEDFCGMVSNEEEDSYEFEMGKKKLNVIVTKDEKPNSWVIICRGIPTPKKKTPGTMYFAGFDDAEPIWELVDGDPEEAPYQFPNLSDTRDQLKSLERPSNKYKKPEIVPVDEVI